MPTRADCFLGLESNIDWCSYSLHRGNTSPPHCCAMPIQTHNIWTWPIVNRRIVVWRYLRMCWSGRIIVDYFNEVMKAVFEPPSSQMPHQGRVFEIKSPQSLFFFRNSSSNPKFEKPQ